MSKPDVHTIRIKNTLTLIAAFPTKRVFATKVGIAPAQVNQLTGRNPTNNIGDVIARRIEKACGKPEYWLDTDHEKTLGKVESQQIEIHVEATLMLNKVLTDHKFPIGKIDPVVYGNLLRHIITMALALGKVTESQVESSLSLANINKATGKR